MSVDTVIVPILDFFNNTTLFHNLVIILLVCLALFLVAAIFRMIFGRKGTAVGAVSATLDIFLLFFLFALLLSNFPAIEGYSPALPFVSFTTDGIQLPAILGFEQMSFAAELVKLIILAFFFGLAHDLLPKGNHFLVRFILQILVCMIVWVGLYLFQRFLAALFPDVIQIYAPVILLILLAILLAVTILKWFFGIILGVSCGFVIGAIYTFFISHIIGKQLTKAVLASFLFLVLLYFANQYNINILFIGQFPTVIQVVTVLSPLVFRAFIAKFM